MSEMDSEKIREAVRLNYSKVAKGQSSSCCSPGSGSSCCCGTSNTPEQIVKISQVLGYSTDEINQVPEGANMGLGCGNPTAIASLKPGERVLDLGSGGGFDCFLAARQVGEKGLVIGVDMTPDMLSKARANAKENGYSNVEFRLGEIENLPVADNQVDVVISNCVINLSTDKKRVFQEIYRVLKPGGRVAVSDVVATAPLTQELKNDLALYSGCISGAAFIDDIKQMLTETGFKEIQIKPKDESKEFISQWAPGTKVEDYVVSANIEARKI